LRSLGLLKWVFALLLLVTLVGTAGYMYLEGAPFLDALYMTVITITTVGYGEIVPLHGPGRLFTMALLFAGFGVIMLAVGVLTQAAVEGSLTRVVERRRVQKQVDKLKNHFVLCGCGRIGRYILDELRQVNVGVVVIDQSESVLAELAEKNVLCLHGNATDEDVLERANLPGAKGLVVTVATDAEAVFIILTARDLNPDLFIVARAIEENNEAKLRRAGANRVISPYRLIGKRLASFILHPAVVDMLDTVMFSSELDLAIEGITVYSSSPLAGRTLRESNIREKLGLMIIGIRKAHGNILFNPAADEIIEPGDTLISIGEKQALQKLSEHLTAES
jgi:voltage-gated potassium channel